MNQYRDAFLPLSFLVSLTAFFVSLLGLYGSFYVASACTIKESWAVRQELFHSAKPLGTAAQSDDLQGAACRVCRHQLGARYQYRTQHHMVLHHGWKTIILQQIKTLPSDHQFTNQFTKMKWTLFLLSLAFPLFVQFKGIHSLQGAHVFLHWARLTPLENKALIAHQKLLLSLLFPQSMDLIYIPRR